MDPLYNKDAFNKLKRIVKGIKKKELAKLFNLLPKLNKDILLKIAIFIGYRNTKVIANIHRDPEVKSGFRIYYFTQEQYLCKRLINQEIWEFFMIKQRYEEWEREFGPRPFFTEPTRIKRIIQGCMKVNFKNQCRFLC
jgi:hypothetical protein